MASVVLPMRDEVPKRLDFHSRLGNNFHPPMIHLLNSMGVYPFPQVAGIPRLIIRMG